VGIILVLQPSHFYKRYLLSLLPLQLMGIGLIGAYCSRRVWGVLPYVTVLAGLSLPPTVWVINHPPQAWKAAGEFLEEHISPVDQVLMGNFQAELAASYYMVGKVPTWNFVYNGMFEDRYKEVPKERGTAWFVQWYGMSPRLLAEFEGIYEDPILFESRYGHIKVFKEREGVEGEAE